MQFQLTISLDNAEAQELGTEAVAHYLTAVSEDARNGYRHGIVRDGNGNTIGQYQTTDQD